MYRYAVCDKNHKVITVIIWDGETKWQPPAGHYVVRHDKCDAGHVYDPESNAFAYPPSPNEGE